jgi:hypothetical protein
VEGWKERAGRNEALFREVNESIAKLENRLESGSETLPVICECDRADCAAQIEIPIAEYQNVRQHADWFIVTRGHEEPEIELVVGGGSGYVIVEKVGLAAEAADGVS